MNVATEVRALLNEGGLDLAPIGCGRTAQRWGALTDIARHDVSLGRLAEAHVDGRQILLEAGRDHPHDRLLGVWASESPRHTLDAQMGAGSVVLRGSKAFCTGAGIVDDAARGRIDR